MAKDENKESEIRGDEQEIVDQRLPVWRPQDADREYYRYETKKRIQHYTVPPQTIFRPAKPTPTIRDAEHKRVAVYARVSTKSKEQVSSMDQLVQSIKERGIITPVTLRPKEDGRYGIVSGHRRRKACELAGFDTVKAEVREMTRDEAIILMVESNLQRSVILPSEKAFSYKMRLEAMNRQGQRTDLTSVPVAQKSTSRELLGKEVGESQDQVRRYIRLTELIPELLDLVDEGRIAFRPAVELSYLQKEEQSALLEQIAYADATPSLAQAIKLKRFSQDGKLNNEVIESIMSEEKPNQREKINIKYAEARRFMLTYTAFLIFYLVDDTLRTDEDIQQYLGLTILGDIPNANNQQRQSSPGSLLRLPVAYAFRCDSFCAAVTCGSVVQATSLLYLFLVR